MDGHGREGRQRPKVGLLAARLAGISGPGNHPGGEVPDPLDGVPWRQAPRHVGDPGWPAERGGQVSDPNLATRSSWKDGAPLYRLKRRLGPRRAATIPTQAAPVEGTFQKRRVLPMACLCSYFAENPAEGAG